MSPCPFCRVAQDRILFESDIGMAFPDAYPVTVGHTLIAPQRHVMEHPPTHTVGADGVMDDGR